MRRLIGEMPRRMWKLRAPAAVLAICVSGAFQGIGKAAPTRDLEAWAAEVEKAGSPDVRAASIAEGCLALVRSEAEKAETVSSPALEQGAASGEAAFAGYSRFCDPHSVAYSLSLSRGALKGEDEALWAKIMSATRAAALLWIRDVKAKDGARVSESHLAVLDAEGRTTFRRNLPLPGPPLSVDAIAGLVRSSIGFDGIALAQEGDLVLARTPDLSGRRELAAIALRNSAGHIFVEEKEPQAEVWMKLERGGKRHSSFRIVFALNRVTVAPGTKLLISR